MRPNIILGFAALAISTALAAAPAVAQPSKQKVLHKPAATTASPTSLTPSSALSPGGIGASPNSYGGGPGFSGEVHGTAQSNGSVSLAGSKGGALSPGGIGASPNSFGGGPGFSGDVNGSANAGKPVALSTTDRRGAPISPGGIGASPNAYNGGPGYQ